MLYFMKPLPESKIDTTEWKPFIKNQWFRKNFMYFVYCLQAMLFIFSIIFGVWRFSNAFIEVGLFVCIFIIHELLHLIIIYKVGDISITHSGIFFWITSGAVLNALRAQDHCAPRAVGRYHKIMQITNFEFIITPVKN